MDWDIKKLVNDPDWQALPYEERFKAIKEVDPDFAALPAAERFKGIQELRATAGTEGAPDLKAAHAANVAAGEAAYKPGWIEAYQQGAQTGGGPGGFLSVMQQMGKDVPAAIAETPQRLAGMATGLVKGAGELVNPENYKSISENPIVDLPGKVGAGIIQGTTEPLISPRTTGKAATEAGIDTLLTMGAAKGAGALATKVAPAAARRIVQSILKPAEGDFKFSKEPVNAFLEEKFTGSLPKIRKDVVARKSELLDEVQSKLAQSTETTPRSDVLSLLDDEVDRIRDTVGIDNKKKLIKRIDNMREDIEAKYPDQLSQSELHSLRKEVDNSISKFTPEALDQETGKFKYNFRTGINNIMEANNPGIAAANKRVSELIDIDRMLGNRVRQAQNAPPLAPGGIAGEVLGTVLGHPGVYTGTRMAGMALGSPAVMTRAAQVLNTFAPKPGLAGAIGSVGAAPVVAPRKPGLAGALERTQPAEPFKGDIHSAVTQAAPAGPAASTVASPQPAGGLGGALNLENLPQIETPVNFGGPGKILDLHTLLGEIEKARRPRSALESTPTLMGTPEESLTLSKIRPIRGGSLGEAIANQPMQPIKSLPEWQRQRLQELMNTKTNKELMDAGLRLQGSTRETTAKASQFVRSRDGHTFSGASFPADFFDKFK